MNCLDCLDVLSVGDWGLLCVCRFGVLVIDRIYLLGVSEVVCFVLCFRVGCLLLVLFGFLVLLLATSYSGCFGFDVGYYEFCLIWMLQAGYDFDVMLLNVWCGFRGLCLCVLFYWIDFVGWLLL